MQDFKWFSLLAGVGATTSWALDHLGVKVDLFLYFTIFLAVDFCLGIIDAYHEDKESVKSSIMKKGIIRKVTNLIIPLLVGLLLRSMNVNTGIYLDTVFICLICSEAYSVFGHILSINSGKKLPEFKGIEFIVGIIVKMIKAVFNAAAKTFGLEDEEEKKET